MKTKQLAIIAAILFLIIIFIFTMNGSDVKKQDISEDQIFISQNNEPEEINLSEEERAEIVERLRAFGYIE